MKKEDSKGETVISLFFTFWGVYLMFTGNVTQGLLALIVGELVDINKKTK